MAQVYSQNIVGYYTVTVNGAGQTMLGNQFTTGGNTLNEVLPGAQPAVYCKTFNGVDIQQDIFDGTQWLDNGSGNPSTTLLPPGTGFIIEDDNTGGTYTMTFVGEVPTGSITVPLPVGQAWLCTPCPEAVPLDTTVGFPQQAGMYIKYFNGTDFQLYINDGSEWLDNGSGATVTLIPAIGQGYGMENDDPTPYSWTHTWP